MKDFGVCRYCIQCDLSSFDSQKRQDNFSLLQNVPELFLSGKAAVAEVNHSSPPNAEVKNERSYTSTPSIRLRGVDRDNFTLFREDSLPGVKWPV
jgi:hypothetical protein